MAARMVFVSGIAMKRTRACESWRKGCRLWMSARVMKESLFCWQVHGEMVDRMLGTVGEAVGGCARSQQGRGPRWMRRKVPDD